MIEPTRNIPAWMSEEVLHAERARGVIINKATIEAAKAVFVYIITI
jgi:hypothetical protein